VISAEAKALGALLIHYSTDYVFDGSKSYPYTEDDAPNPINAYGRSKLMGEEAIQAVDGDYVILRTSWVYAVRGANFLRTILRLAQERDELRVVSDQIGAPTWARLIAESTAHVIRQSQAERLSDLFRSNLYHFASAGTVSWFGFAEAIIEQAHQIPGFSTTLNEIRPVPSCDYQALAQRPMNSCLETIKFEKHFNLKMPLWSTALKLCLAECR
jgi:dTDP-4-dehydrorhamnose reductase